MTILNNKKVIASFGILLFSIFMVFEVSVQTERVSESQLIEIEKSIEKNPSLDECSNSINISLNSALASDPGDNDGGTSPCTAIGCLEPSSCGSFGPCPWREVCDGCSCKFEQVGSFAGSNRCG